MSTEFVCMAGALSLSLAGAIADVANRRIPNRLTYLGIVLALALRTAGEGWHGAASALLGGLIGGGIFILFFLIRAMGGGDVKLMAAVGCFAGQHLALEAVLATAIAGGVMAVALSLAQGRLRVLAANTFELIRFHAVSGMQAHPELNLSNPRAKRLPYGVAIAAGVMYTALACWCRGEL